MAAGVETSADEHPLLLDGELPRACKVREPSIFAGDRYEVSDWLEDMKEYCQGTGVSESRWLFVSKSYLSKTLKKWVHRKQKSATPFRSFQNFAEALKKRYIDPLEQDYRRDTLEELQYSKAQGMESFGDAFLDLAEEIKDTSTPADLIHIFKKAIPDPICLEVNKKAPSTFEEAVEAACIAAETLEGRGRNRKRHAQTGGSRPNGKYQGGSNSNRPVPMQLDAVYSLSSKERAELMRQGRCFLCKQKGHEKKDCLSFLFLQRRFGSNVPRLQQPYGRRPWGPSGPQRPAYGGQRGPPVGAGGGEGRWVWILVGRTGLPRSSPLNAQRGRPQGGQRGRAWNSHVAGIQTAGQKGDQVVREGEEEFWFPDNELSINIEGEQPTDPYVYDQANMIGAASADGKVKMIRFQGTVEGIPVRVLLDCGAGEIFLSAQFAHNKGLPIKKM
uniref:CCHC-type domain-containing protein n=1 Tax=Chromera velia CCMP2878 TaxID=1169474 RepID=A0A0G4HXE7_9ALVE|eukprot:Cvel_9260.t1-p1 / transcript=Cvel_9260.t1 / gene=Cvel_9260 / organism=Chromera_velia_CCMP2878 / gene_product=hypothetical protein / transcript_product=hypothetical protein / location=Cvel_scaffold529:49828-51156(+) / protein_length=443 / sequence_SO=supercontig / SO=protein_coding / is_pseudo=false